MDRKQSRNEGGQGNERDEPAREGFGDDMGTRVGRPDPASADALDDRSAARLSDSADDRGLEGAILAGSDNPTGSPGRTETGARSGERSSTRADGSSLEGTGRGETLDHTQRAESGTPERGALSGMGGEANQGVHGAQRNQRAGQGAPDGARIERGTDEQSPDRSGSEPLRGRQNEHRPSYGGEGGAPRTSSDQREDGVDYYGDEETGKKR
jgi:hypothetical protein